LFRIVADEANKRRFDEHNSNGTAGRHTNLPSRIDRAYSDEHKPITDDGIVDSNTSWKQTLILRAIECVDSEVVPEVPRYPFEHASGSKKKRIPKRDRSVVADALINAEEVAFEELDVGDVVDIKYYGAAPPRYTPGLIGGLARVTSYTDDTLEIQMERLYIAGEKGRFEMGDIDYGFRAIDKDAIVQIRRLWNGEQAGQDAEIDFSAYYELELADKYED
jgi:hypothetical protein